MSILLHHFLKILLKKPTTTFFSLLRTQLMVIFTLEAVHRADYLCPRTQSLWRKQQDSWWTEKKEGNQGPLCGVTLRCPGSPLSCSHPSPTWADPVTKALHGREDTPQSSPTCFFFFKEKVGSQSLVYFSLWCEWNRTTQLKIQKVFSEQSPQEPMISVLYSFKRHLVHVRAISVTSSLTSSTLSTLVYSEFFSLICSTWKTFFCWMFIVLGGR